MKKFDHMLWLYMLVGAVLAASVRVYYGQPVSLPVYVAVILFWPILGAIGVSVGLCYLVEKGVGVKL